MSDVRCTDCGVAITCPNFATLSGGLCGICLAAWSFGWKVGPVPDVTPGSHYYSD